MRLEDLGLIGNCQYSALVSRYGDIVWCCLPRFDSEPLFSTLLDEKEGGSFKVCPAEDTAGSQRYVENTNVLETTFTSGDGTFRVIDFAPRYLQWDRSFRPTKIIRIIEPVDGVPRVRVHCAPKLGWSKRDPGRSHGSNHLNFHNYSADVRLTTDIPLTYLGGKPFVLTERKHLVLSWDEPVHTALAPLCDTMLRDTTRYWQRWVKHCNIPPLFQSEVIRSALALKLHCFEDTGAIVAAMTTSIPESTGSGRTWDYRYCWLRDSYYALGAFRLVGHYEEREQFLTYLLNIAAGAPDLALAPLYRIDGGTDLEEQIVQGWAGYEGEGPVRNGNAAATHLQHDIFGELVLALTPLFLDDRFKHDRTKPALDLVTRLARRAIALAGTPDAGIWEYRTEMQPQTFSSLMSWAGADRMAQIAERHAPELVSEFRTAATTLREQILTRAWNESLGSLVSTYGGTDLDAALLQAAPLRFLAPSDPRLGRMVDTLAKALGRNGWLFRYQNDDGFGVPQVAFVICTFWLADALAMIGRKHEAVEILERVAKTMTPLGLLAEDWSVSGTRMMGNFPQAYSHVGLIHAAFAASPNWSELL